MYTEEEMTKDAIAEELSVEVDVRIAALNDEDRNSVVAALPEALWKPEQVYEFAKLAKQWMTDAREVCVRIHNYRGLEIVRERTHDELVTQVIDNEISRRRTANWEEAQKAKVAEAEEA
jgi:hypothetical protein